MTRLVYRLELWSTTRDHPDDSPYRAPEQRPTYLRGRVYDHPDHAPGTKVTTSAVKSARGRVATTAHSCYRLGAPDPAWLAWMAENGISFDPEHPIRVVRGPR